MATYTKVGLEWISDKTLDNESGVIQDIAVGTDDSSESYFATALGSEEYRASTGDPNVTLTETDDSGRFEVEVEVTGGTEVPAGTDITEVGLFESNGTLILIGNFSVVPVASASTEAFRVIFNPEAL